MPNRERLGTASFPRAAETPALQAADYLAYLSYVHWQLRMEVGLDSMDSPPPLPLIVEVIKRIRDIEDFVLLDRDFIRHVLKDIPLDAI